MREFIELAILLPFIIMLYQFYRFSVQRTGPEKQKACQILGIVYSTFGITALAIHSPLFVIAGLLLIMFGLRLIAHGLDRVDKQIFIDRYDKDQ